MKPKYELTHTFANIQEVKVLHDLLLAARIGKVPPYEKFMEEFERLIKLSENSEFLYLQQKSDQVCCREFIVS